MPQQTYNVGFGANDFFYKKTDPDMTKTIPLNVPNLVTWAKTYDNTISSTTTDIFDPKISAVVIANKTAFVDNYLKGNITVDANFSNFDTRTIDLTLPAGAASAGRSYDNSILSGSLTIGSSNSKYPEINFDLSANEPNIQYKTDAAGNLQADISLNIPVNSSEFPYLEPNGSTSYISVNTANPRCKYQTGCTDFHWHYSSCKKQTITNRDGTTYCKCVCSGPKTLDANPHDHCSPVIIGSSFTDEDGNVNSAEYESSMASLIKNIKLSLKQDVPQYEFTGRAADGRITLDYKAKSDLVNNDVNIRNKLYDYYYELNRNIELQNKLINTNNLDSTTVQALNDSNVRYKKEYLQLFNIFSGILFAGGYIYVMNKPPPIAK